MALGTGWLPSSSDGGHNHYPSDTGDSSGRLRSKCGNRPCSRSGRGRASSALAHQGGWQSGVLSRVSVLLPRFQGGECGGAHLLEVQDDRQPAETIDMGLGFPRPMFNCEVVLLQRC